jgi:hypothetical protein
MKSSKSLVFLAVMAFGGVVGFGSASAAPVPPIPPAPPIPPNSDAWLSFIPGTGYVGPGGFTEATDPLL